MPLVQTRGAASAQGFGEFAQAAVAANYIEEVFSCFLYKGNSSTQTITNGIDLSTKGGLTWIKRRNGANNNVLFDTSRGVGNVIASDSTTAQFSDSVSLTAFNTTGFTLGDDSVNGNVNYSASTYASWTFREQPKFFDVVTYTGDGTNNRAISHNLGSTPGFIIVKTTSTAQSWICYHTALGTGNYLSLNGTGAASADANAFPAVSSTTFTPTANDSLFSLNTSSVTFVAYLFAHDAGGFGLTGTDNVISCGSFTADGSANFSVTLGYEPQFVMCKSTNNSGPWFMLDTMRGYNLDTTNGDQYLMANSSNAEAAGELGSPTATGFVGPAGNVSTTYIYIAIRRGPMKVPTSGTSVFKVPYVRTGGGSTQDITGASYPVNDLVVTKSTSNTQTWAWTDRLRGATKELTSAATTAETTYANDLTSFAFNTGFQVGSGAGGQMNTSGYTYIDYTFRRAPSFFDEVCYSGNSTARTINHNLGVAPELMIVKARSGTYAGSIDWFVYASPLGNSSRLLLNDNGALADGQPVWNSTTPTSSVFSLGTSDNINGTGYTYVNYLFSTCAGVSKVGSYTGTGTTKQIDCGFTGGARFVLIKRTDSTGDWYVWDSARGIVSGNDSYLLLNSTAAEVTNTDYIDTYSAGFEISSTAPAAINASGGIFIFFAVA